MKKFVIVNNGMTEMRGHYLETAYAVAEEATRHGYDVHLVVHEKCEINNVPPGVTTHSIFRVDHWGHDMSITAIVNSLRLEPRLQVFTKFGSVEIADVRSGTSDIQQYLNAHFQKPKVSLRPVKLKNSVLSTTNRRIRRLIALMSPYALHIVADRIRPKLKKKRLRRREKRETKRLSRGLSNVNLAKHISEKEIGMKDLFRADLNELFCMIGVAPDDIVFHPTAHGRELCAIHELVDQAGTEASPFFHLEFRHPVVPVDGTGVPESYWRQWLDYSKVHDHYFKASGDVAKSKKIKLYTDTAELQDDYQKLSCLSFDVLPIPFRTKMLTSKPDAFVPLSVLFLGDPREEKGFHLLPSLVNSVFETHVKPGKIKFSIQAGIHHSSRTPEMEKAFNSLSNYDDEHVELFGLDGFVSETEYYDRLSQADIVLLPYDAVGYRSRSSGVLAEAVSASKPVIVPAKTWLASQVSEGAGEAYDSAEGMTDALKKVFNDYKAYRASAESMKEHWLKHHSVNGLVSAIIENSDSAGAGLGSGT